MGKPTTIDEYIDAAPDYAQAKFRELRALLHEVAPNATEAIKWGNPVLEEQRILFSFTAYKNHINFMPTSSSLTPFKEELKSSTTGKDSLQIPYDKPLDRELIRKIAEHRRRDVLENGSLWMG